LLINGVLSRLPEPLAASRYHRQGRVISAAPDAAGCSRRRRAEHEIPDFDIQRANLGITGVAQNENAGEPVE
jgi:hypothetical protein